MVDKILDVIGIACMFMIFLGPPIIASLIFRFLNTNRGVKIACAALLSIVCVILMLAFGMGILFRGFIGPG